MEMDPAKLRPMAGVMVVEVVEVLGGYTKGGLFIPGTMMDHGGKDTALVQVLRLGDAPIQRVGFKDGEWGYHPCEPWEAASRNISVGDIVLMPRDVPLVFVWGEKRYALVYEHEAILAMDPSVLAENGFEVVPWKPDEVPGSIGQ